MNTIDNVSKTLQSAYDEQYTDSMTEWRELGGRYKAQNIIDVCKGYSFSKVLECGAGEGSILKELEKKEFAPRLYALELSDSGISQIRKRQMKSLNEVLKFDGYNIPYPDKEFDLAYCSHVIEHVEHPRILLRELKRVSEYQVFEIPLDYSPNADEKVHHFLSYGHINIFTPSLFKFLLKSEGFEILSERFTQSHEEIIRFNWYRNQGLPKSLKNEIKLRLRPLRNNVKRFVYGKKRHEEFGHSAYTCLAKSRGELKIF
ncbi:class I SAM-dependent methyltransferase [Pelagibius litoralis]|uniref:Class I SAM-dependent methyltransferase n=1 Tax=Pelagibius litoralis TaxID=374515 RepID=A0A967EZM3_9PROT|nr:class I SAM-dependent methyltransferase [Pelagibius litoralis]NIA70328.1 class I SAM-dependent methyltransferase [Pelagibius litoralis]